MMISFGCSTMLHEARYFTKPLPVPSRLRQLCDLESLGYIRYCPYPEEFWVALPAGKELLSKSKFD
jgi:hypothetical protein